MKRVIFLILTLMFFPTLLFAQSGLINPNQVAPITINLTASENLTAGDVVSIVNGQAKKNNLAVNTSPNGSESVFNSAATTYCSAVALDSTRFLVAFIDSDTYPKAVVGTVSGSSISWGAKATVYSAASTYLSVCKIDTDKVLFCFNCSGATQGLMDVATISVNSITVDQAHIAYFRNDAVTYVSVTPLDTNKALVCYAFNNVGRCNVISVSTTTPLAGAEASFNAAATSYISVSALSATSAIVAYQDGGNSNYGTAQVLSISGTTITPGTEYVFASDTSYYCRAVSLSSTMAILAWQSTTGKTTAANISGTGISYGTVNSQASITYEEIGLSFLDSTKALICFQDGSNTNKGKSAIITTDGTTTTVSTPVIYNSTGGTNYNSSCYLGSQKSAICYQDAGNSSYGTAVVNTWATSDYSAVRGLCTTTTSSGASAPILISGSYDGLTSLVTGSQYFVGADFALTTAPVSLAIMKNSSTQTGEIYFGTAKSSTEIIVGVDYK